ncbi:MAG: hydrogenase maturation protease [Phycisphaerae bacterium]
MSRPVLVLCLGQRLRGDDAVGLSVASELRERVADVARVESREHAIWEVIEGGLDARLVVIVDAAEPVAGLPPGACQRIRFPQEADRLEPQHLRDTHSLSVESLLKLANRLQRLPPEVWIYAVTGSAFEFGAPLSAPVLNAAPQVARQVADDIRGWLNTQAVQHA